MVEVAVSQQDPVEPSEAGPAAQQLTLRPFSAIDQDAVAACLYQNARMIALCRRNACRRTQESEIEHRRQVPLSSAQIRLMDTQFFSAAASSDRPFTDLVKKLGFCSRQAPTVLFLRHGGLL